MTNKLNTVRDSHHHAHEEEEEEGEFFITQPAIIFDALSFEEEIPYGFNAVKIGLGGTMQANLAWKEARIAASKYIKQGYRLFWEIDLGLFKSLNHPLSHQAQFLSLCLSLEHFRDSLWKEFRTSSLGLSLYRGSADFSLHFPWDNLQIENLQGWLQELFGDISAMQEEVEYAGKDFTTLCPEQLTSNVNGRRLLSLFCRDVGGEYLALLAQRLPDSIPLFALMDPIFVKDSLLLSQLLHKERYARFCLAVKGKNFFPEELAWEAAPLSKGVLTRCLVSPIEKQVSVGICLPAMQKCRQKDTEGLNQAFSWLEAQKMPFKVISEEFLASEWDGLDHIIVAAKSVTPQGKRKLQGFCAAGGQVVTMGELLGLPNETSFKVWQQLGFKYSY